MVGNITFSGMASGLPPDLVDRLMEVQKQRLKGLEKNKSYFSGQKDAFTELKTKLTSLKSKAETLQDATQFTPRSATSADTDKISVSASSSALAGTHFVQVDRLATNNTWMTGTGVTSSSATLDGAETFSFDYNGTTYNVALSAGDNINNIASKISSTDYGDEDGVSASVLFDGSNYRLVLTAKDSGAYVRDGTGATTTERISNISFGTLAFSGGTQNLTDAAVTKTTSGVDARIQVDGLANIYSSSNSVSEVIPGLTMNLKDTTAATVAVTVTNDTEALKKTVNDFIDSYNGVVDLINQKKGTVFSAEASVRSVMSELRGVLNTATDGVTGNYSLLSEIGITTLQSTGKLSLNSTTFDDKVAEDFESVSEIFTKEPAAGDKGVAFRMEELIDNLTSSSSSGVIYGKTKGLESRISFYDSRIEREQARLEKVKDRLNKQFAHLEQLASSMNNTGSAMAAALSKM